MTRRWGYAALVAVLVTAVGTGGCSGVRQALGTAKSSPDAFAVTEEPPLTMPPDYDLRPPEPGAPRPQAESASEKARAALTGEKTAAAGALSSGEKALLAGAGADRNFGNIRGEVNRESHRIARDEQAFTERLMWWSEPAPSGTTVNPRKEARRLQENRSLGRPVTEGETPTIKRRSRALLEDVF